MVLISTDTDDDFLPNCDDEPVPELQWTFLQFDKECQVDTLCFEKLERRPTILEVLIDDKSISSCAGLSSVFQFNKLCEAVEYVVAALDGKRSKCAIDVPSQVLLTLMKLKLNLSFRCLSCLFGVGEKSSRETFYYMIDVLYSILKQFVAQPTKDQILRNMPVYFRGGFEDTVVVVDCAEIPVMKRKCLNCVVLTYSHYKGRNTVKFEVEVSPDGTIIGVSKVFGGRASDKHIFMESKVLERCEKENAVMCDKGYDIDDECAKENVQLHRPPFFFKGKQQFEPHEVVLGRRIARARVHVERVIQRIRLFRIMADQLDWSLLESIDKILNIICALVNLSPPVLHSKRFPA